MTEHIIWIISCLEGLEPIRCRVIYYLVRFVAVREIDVSDSHKSASQSIDQPSGVSFLLLPFPI